jgi:hypothetical protein
MTYSLYDETDARAELGTNTGLKELMDFLRSTDIPEAVEFADTGEFLYPEALLEAIEDLTHSNKNIYTSLEALKEGLRKCNEWCFVWNGIDGGEE